MSEITKLPEPRQTSETSIEETLRMRRSVRSFSDESLTLKEISQLLWSVQGTRAKRQRRTAPSAGALYPLEIYAVMATGVHHYDPEQHTLTRILQADVRGELCSASWDQQFVLQAPLTVAITAVYERIAVKYGTERGLRYVYMEVGHAAQNLALQAVALGLGSVPVGAFKDAEVQRVLGVPEDHEPLYLLPVGHPA
ncbi:MAG TPA: SagB/ThcOx family dehydrogenase [Anaerolineae bacterium]|nr:SagB/ThcOx family dehydrogenase [Anaerolineae bacterium]